MVRIKHRYLLAQILYPDATSDAKTKAPKSTDEVPYTIQVHRPSSDRLDGRLLVQMIRNGVAELFGDYGSGMVASSLQVKYFSPPTSTAIIRVARDHFRLIWAALTFTTRLPKPVDQACVIQVVRISGTIRKAEEAAIQLARGSIKRARRQAARGKGTELFAGAAEVIDDTGDEHVSMEDDLGFAGGIEDGDEDEDDDYAE